VPKKQLCDADAPQVASKSLEHPQDFIFPEVVKPAIALAEPVATNAVELETEKSAEIPREAVEAAKPVEAVEAAKPEEVPVVEKTVEVEKQVEAESEVLVVAAEQTPQSTQYAFHPRVVALVQETLKRVDLVRQHPRVAAVEQHPMVVEAIRKLEGAMQHPRVAALVENVRQRLA